MIYRHEEGEHLQNGINVNKNWVIIFLWWFWFGYDRQVGFVWGRRAK
jgi:hypothetical protein